MSIKLANASVEQAHALTKLLSEAARRLGMGEHSYIVGGAPRDFALGFDVKDIDVVVEPKDGKNAVTLAEEVAKMLGGLSVHPDQYGVVHIGPVPNDQFYDGVNLKGQKIEIVTSRKEKYDRSKDKGSHKPSQVEPGTILEDLLRRDFTFNCMTGETLIPTEKGLVRIDEIASVEGDDHTHQAIQLDVAGRDGPAAAVGWQYSGHTGVLRVETEWGHTFSCTPQHPVLVLRGHDHEWVETAQLEPGDLLCAPVKQIVRRTPLDLTLSDPTPKKRGRFKEIRKPCRMTPELAFLLGLVITEGSNTDKRVSFSNSDAAILSRYAECFNSVFGFLPSKNKVVEKGSVRRLRGVDFVAHRDGYDLYADSRVAWLAELGLYCGGAKDGKSASHHKVVPWAILQADEQSQSAFLAAYLEGDGSIRSDGMVVFCSSSRELRQQLQAVLGSHGVLSRIQDRFVYVNAADAAKLWPKIQPYMVTKRYGYEGRKFKARNRYGVPKDYLFGFLKGRRVRFCNKGSTFRTDDGAEVTFPKWSRHIQPQVDVRLLHDAAQRGEYNEFMGCLRQISPEEHLKLDKLFQLGYQYVPVTSVEDAGEQDVYDITMHEGVEPAFVANGVVVHNTLVWRLLDVAEGPDKKAILDLTGMGMKDLQRKIVETPLDPVETFSDDPSRMLRAIRFAVKYGFELDPATRRAIKAKAKDIKRMPYEAVDGILFNKILPLPDAKKALSIMKGLGLLDPVIEMIPPSRLRRAVTDRVQNVSMLLTLAGYNIPSGLEKLSKEHLRMLRRIEEKLSLDDLETVYERLIKPPIDTRKLMKDTGIQGKAVGDAVERARDLLLEDPFMRPQELQERLTQELAPNYDRRTV